MTATGTPEGGGESAMPTDNASDKVLLATYEIVLGEVAGYPVDAARLRDALPLFREIMGEIRRLDELDLERFEPATTFAPER
jgi:hypothetical protein